MEELREKLEDIIDSIKGIFSKNTNGEKKSFKETLSSISMENVVEWIESKAMLLFGLLIVITIGFFYLLWQIYVPYKQDLLNIQIQKANVQLLEVVKEKKEKNKAKFDSINKEIIVPPSFNISDAACFFLKFDKDYISYVNPQYKIKQLNFNEEDQTFSVEFAGIKYYKSISDLLVLLKQYKTLINIDSYDVSITPEESNGPVVEYYTINIRGSFSQKELPSVSGNIEEESEE